MIKMPSVRTETEFFAFGGGLDVVSPALMMPAGALIASQNYEPDAEGGYSRMLGYERFDGRTAPSSVVTNLSGAYTAAQEAQNLVDLADVNRALINPPAGSGPVRGVCYYSGALYCFKDNAGATEGKMWKSSSSGWTAVALNESVAFTNANASVGDGDILTQGGVTAAIQRVVVETGSLASGVNTGRLIIAARAGGNFSAAAATSTGGGTLTLSGVQTAQTLPPGGRYEFDIYNFTGMTSLRKMYGANGVGKCFEFDGTCFVFINTGAAIDTPKYIKGHRKYLYVAIGSSIMNSSIAAPYRWVAAEGAAEIAVGDDVSGVCSMPGDALGVMCRNSSHQLVGASSASWQLLPIRSDVGCVPYTLQTMSDTYMLDDRGVISITAAQEYGNFSDSTLSRKIQKLIDNIRTKVVGSYVNRQKGHFILLMNDGATLTMCISNRQLKGFTQGALGFIPSCVWSGEDATGVERIFVGSSAGMVYEMNKGSTFDGDAITAMCKVYYYNSKSPRLRKRYRKAIVEMTAVLYSELRFSAEYSYGDPDIESTRSEAINLGGSGASWGASNWSEFYWGMKDINQPELPLDGTGLNIALSFYSNTKLDFGHTLQGALMHYSVRRLQR
jgi:hypothetical protein